MEKGKYYVSVEEADIQTQPEENRNEYFEIEATQRDLIDLRFLFHDIDGGPKTLDYAMMPLKEKEKAENVRYYRRRLKDIYSKIYLLGTRETKEKIKELDILGQLHS